MDDLTRLWKSARSAQPASTINTAQLIETANQKKRASLRAHYYTIAILSITLISLVSFFVTVAPMQQTLSRIGIALMLGGLVIRIGVEVASLVRGSKIDWQAQPDSAIKQAKAFYQFRKQIHGAFTMIILVLYVIGFYLLTPEFSQYLSKNMMIYIHVSFVVVAVILFWQIRKGVRREVETLQELARIGEGWK